VADRVYVFFDVDDTLIEWKASWRDAFAVAAGRVGVTVSRERAWQVLEEAFRGCYAEHIERHAPQGEVEAFWRDYDGEILRRLGVRDRLDEAVDYVLATLGAPGAMGLYPEVPDVLEALSRAGAKLGIVTGRPAALPDLERLGVARWFDPVIDAFAAGSPKSAGHMFRLAAEAAAAEGRRAWHVGDSYEDDVLGARAAGLQPVLLDRRGERPEADCLRVGSLGEVIELIAGHTGAREGFPV